MSDSPFRRFLTDGWRLRAAADTTAEGTAISRSGFEEAWTPAIVPGTVLGALTAAGEVVDPYVADHLEGIDGARFEGAWWFRTEFVLDEVDLAEYVSLCCDGINYRANVWVNGRRIATSETVAGTFRRHRFDLTRHVAAGPNALAFEIFPPRPGEFSTGFVDWNPAPPDGNMGLFRDVILRVHGPATIEDPYVDTRLDADGAARVTVRSLLVNHARTTVKGRVRGRLGDAAWIWPVTLAPRQRLDLEIGPEEVDALRFETPPLWWPHELGTPYLVDFDLAFETETGPSDAVSCAVGLREVSDFFTPEGHRGFRVNGEPILIKGGGWTDDLFLMDTPGSIEAQIRYVRHMGLNTIRLEGVWGKDHALYDLCDRYGILLLVGWSCHWEHESYLGASADARYGGITEEASIRLVARSWEDQVRWLRRHPSIFVWAVASDKQPAPALERRYVDIFRRSDPTRPYLNSTAGVGSEQGIITDEAVVSEISGSSGMKMLGPYAYTPPVYWYTDTRLGGAYGFNTETGPGAQPPPLESLRRMLTPAHFWPIDDVWSLHCAQKEFATMDRFVEAMTRRLGAPTDLEDFSRKADVLTYELTRPMFEAFRAHKRRPEGRATGVVHWMLNSAWPSLYWQLYGHDLVPGAATFATRRACAPLHLLYHYGDGGVYLVNAARTPRRDLTAVARTVGLDGREHARFTLPAEVETNGAVRLGDAPAPEEGAGMWLLELVLKTDGAPVDRSVYWLSATSDVLDYDARVEPWSYYTPSVGFADFTALAALPQVDLEVEAAWADSSEGRRVEVELTHPYPADAVAFFVQMRVVDAETDVSVVPVLWSDNAVTLFPGDRLRLTADLPPGDERLRLEVDGWNVPPVSRVLHA